MPPTSSRPIAYSGAGFACKWTGVEAGNAQPGDDPVKRQPGRPQRPQHETRQADRAQHVLRTLPVAGEELHRQQIEKAFDETA